MANATGPTAWCVYQYHSQKTLLIINSANSAELQDLIRPLGLHKVRAKRLTELSSTYVSDPPTSDRLHPSRATYVYVKTVAATGRAGLVMTMKYPPTPISHLPGVGAYALDSYRIFCTPGEAWKHVLPTDKELIRWMVSDLVKLLKQMKLNFGEQRWKWAFFERCRWEPDRGIVAPLDKDYLEALPDLLAP